MRGMRRFGLTNKCSLIGYQSERMTGTHCPVRRQSMERAWLVVTRAVVGTDLHRSRYSFGQQLGAATGRPALSAETNRSEPDTQPKRVWMVKSEASWLLRAKSLPIGS